MSRSKRRDDDIEFVCGDDVDRGEPGAAVPGADCSGADVPHRSSFGFTAFENRALDLARLMLEMHRSGEKNTWFTAMELAESAEGPFEGPHLIARITAFVRALPTERDRPYAYMSAGCMYVSADEAELMRVVRLARTGPFSELKAAAQALAGRDHVCRLLGSAALLAQPDGMRKAAAKSARGPGESEADADRPARLH